MRHCFCWFLISFKSYFYFFSRINWMRGLLFSFSFFFYFFPETAKLVKINTSLRGLLETIIYSHKRIYFSKCRGTRLAFSLYIQHACMLQQRFWSNRSSPQDEFLKKVLLKCPQIAWVTRGLQFCHKWITSHVFFPDCAIILSRRYSYFCGRPVSIFLRSYLFALIVILNHCIAIYRIK